MGVVSMKQLLEAGVHFGHQTKRWNPKMRPFIFTSRNGIHIVDLRITAERAERAYTEVKNIAQAGGNIIFVGTKKQAQDLVAEEAKRCGAHFVNQRWFGGTLTNFVTIHQRILKLRELDEREATGEIGRLAVKEQAKVRKLRDKLTKFLGGLKNMDVVPEAIFVTDTLKDHAAVLEAGKLGITVIAIVDTNCNPEEVDMPIPGNDDAIRSIRFFTHLMSSAMIEGREGVDIEASASSEAGETPEATTEEAVAEEKVIEIVEAVVEEVTETVETAGVATPEEVAEVIESAETTEESIKENE
jgi:small subunit ribosomal protein S2